MAYWVVGGGGPPDVPEQSYLPYEYQSAAHGAKRTSSYDDDNDHYDYEAVKRARLEDWEGAFTHHHHHHHHHHHNRYDQRPSRAESDSVRVKNLAFLVIREGTQTPEEHHGPRYYPPPAPQPLPSLPGGLTSPPPPAVLFSSAPMERTESGLSISSDNTTAHDEIPDDDPLATSTPLIADLQAAHLVRAHVQSSRQDSKHSRILHSLIQPRMEPTPGRPTRAFPLDDSALHSLFQAANALFFAHRLSNRVAWDWSHPSSPSSPSSSGSDSSSSRYAHHVVGTTALRRSASPRGGYETLIVLSSPILRDTRYNRRLLIATFLHEMIHSFLFVTCGIKAARGGGHTEGFRIIAETIDEWVGRDRLRLADMEADLERFRGGDVSDPGAHHVCGGGYAAPLPGSHRERDGGWECFEQEGFRTRGPTGPGSSYVR